MKRLFNSLAETASYMAPSVAEGTFAHFVHAGQMAMKLAL